MGNPGSRNPFLADSQYPIAHGRSDQQDNSPLTGPNGPGRVIGDADRQYTWTGPGHFGSLISGPYADGRRVIWSNGREQILKLDYETLEVLAAIPVAGQTVTPTIELEAAVDELDRLAGDEALDHALGLALQYMTGLDGVYALLDVDHTLFLGRTSGAVAYIDADPADPASPIVERDRWDLPDDIVGAIVGVNMTFDGRLVLTTDTGWVVALERDFSAYEAARLPGAEEQAQTFNKHMDETNRPGYSWVRTSCCVDDGGGIYVSSVDHTHKVIWTGEQLSLDPDDGAWSAEYRNGAGFGSGTTPCLMGFGDDEDRFVVLGDGDEVVNITLMWRDAIPDDWEQLAEAPSRRIAGLGPANMGDPDLPAIQTEQSITVSGYGAMTVNNEPRTVPEALRERGQRLLVFYLGHDPAYTPHGLHKYAWDPVARRFSEAWVNTEVSSPNSVPFVSEGADLVYTCGARDGQWTIEAVNWTTGEAVFHHVTGSSRFNTLGAGVMLDEEGRLLFGSMFAKTRLL
jgi:hypothetical protein